MVGCQGIRSQKKVDNRDVVGVAGKILLDSRIHREFFVVNGKLADFSLKDLLFIDKHFFRSEQSMVILAVPIFNVYTIKDEGIVKLDQECLIPGIGEIHVIITFLPFLGQMIHDVKDGESEIGLSRSIGTIDDTVLDDIIFNGIGAETIVVMSGKIPFDLILESPEIFYGKLC